jgi:hypothetical protein
MPESDALALYPKHRSLIRGESSRKGHQGGG